MVNGEGSTDNTDIRYTMWSVFRAATPIDVDGRGDRLASTERQRVAAEVDQVLEEADAKGVTTRGTYDTGGFRADADVMFWWVAEEPDALQDVYARFRRTTFGRCCEPVFSVIGVHRPAEFNRAHVPAFIEGKDPRRYLCIYPYDRSYEWYLLDPAERRDMLAEHGKMARPYSDVNANTVASFALSDYEWVLAFEADEPHRLTDLMRTLRGAAARRHTRLEVPFYTGSRKPVSEIVAALP